MANVNYTDIAKTIDTLSCMVECIERELIFLDQRLSDAKAERRKHIASQVKKLLPDFSESTINGIRAAVPSFLDQSVVNFVETRKMRNGSDDTAESENEFMALHVRLASFLDMAQMQPVTQLDLNIGEILKGRASLDEKRYEVRHVLDFLQERQSEIDLLPDAVQTRICNIVEKVKASMDARVKQVPISARDAPCGCGDQPWLEFLSDNQESFQALVASTLIHNRL